MKRILALLFAAAVAGALLVAGPLGAAPKGTEHYNTSKSVAGTCEGDDTMTVIAPEKLWPPNHKYFEDIHVVVTDASGDRVDLVTTGTHNQYDGDTETNGAGHTADDMTVNPADEGARITSAGGTSQVVAEEGAARTVTTDWMARAERAGRDETKSGRVYTLTADSRSSDGDVCSADVTFTVPHDMRPSNR